MKLVKKDYEKNVLDNQCGIKNWIRSNSIAILIFVMIEVIVISYSANVWKAISEKSTSSYHLETSYHTEVLEADGNEYYYNADISANKLFQIEFKMDVLSGSGEAGWKLYEGEECILTGNLQGDSFNQGVCRINFDPGISYSGATYRIRIDPINDTSLQIYVDDNNYLNATYCYLFTYGNILHTLVIVINILVGILMMLLVSKLSIYVKFWIIAISMGLLSIVIVIPCSTADEFRHFARAYSLTNGEFATNYDDEGNSFTEIPVNLYNYRYIAQRNSTKWGDETNFTLNLPRELYYLGLEDMKETVNARLVGVEGKGLVEYLPQVVVMWIGKLFHVRQVCFFYIARFGNWLAITMMWFVAIRILPRHKMLFVVLYSMPTNIVYSCTSSTDGLLNALIMMIMAIAIKIYYDEIELTDKRILIPVIIISVYISVIKLPYVLVAYTLIALSLKSENKKYNLGKIVRNTAIITGICLLGYLVRVALSEITQINGIANVSRENVNAHIGYALDHLLEAIQICIQTFVYKFDAFYRQALAVNSLNINIVILPYSILMLYAASAEKEKKEIDGVQALLLSFICLGMWGSILLVSYFCWSEIGATELKGIQGRYMCPIIMIATVTLAMRKENRKQTVEERYIPAVCLGIMFVGLMNIFQIQWC